MTLALLAWLAAINALAFEAFRVDKRRAERGLWRIPESRLLMLAFLGGWPGAKLAQRRYRHKTRKQPFATVLNLTPAAWVGAGLLLVMSPVTIAALATGLGAHADVAVHRTSEGETFAGTMPRTNRPLSSEKSARRFFQKSRDR